MPGVHHRYVVGEPADDGEVVADEQQRGTVEFVPPQQVQHLRLHRDVQRGGRLVGQHQGRPGRYRRGDERPLAQPARQLVGVLPRAPPRLGHADVVEQREHLGGDLGTRDDPVGAQHLRDLGTDRAQRVQRHQRVLEHQPDPPAAHGPPLRLGERGQVLPGEKEPARAYGGIPAGEADEGARGDALTRAGLPHQRQAAARVQGERDIADGVHRFAAGREGDTEAVDDQQRLCRQILLRRRREVRRRGKPCRRREVRRRGKPCRRREVRRRGKPCRRREVRRRGRVSR